jgi:hypothetical protein
VEQPAPPGARVRRILHVAALILLVGVIGFFAVDIVRWNRSLDDYPDRTFTVKRVYHTKHGCGRASCWNNSSLVIEGAQRMRYDDHFVHKGDRCTTKGRSDRIIRCVPAGEA